MGRCYSLSQSWVATSLSSEGPEGIIFNTNKGSIHIYIHTDAYIYVYCRVIKVLSLNNSTTPIILRPIYF